MPALNARRPDAVFVAEQGVRVGLLPRWRYAFLGDDLCVTAVRKETLNAAADSSRSEVLVNSGVDLSWLSAAPKDAASPESLRTLYKGLQQCLRTLDYGVINGIFEAVEVKVFPAETLVALLRYSFAAHKKLNGWNAFLSKVREEFDRRGLDTRTLLTGLEAVGAERA